MRAQKAFTFIEIILACALVLSVYQLFFYSYQSSLSRNYLKEELCFFFTITSQVQQLAMATGAEQQLFIFSEKNSYSYPVTHKARVTRELSSEIRFGVKPGTYGPPGRPTSVIKKIATFELFDDKKSIFVIRFFPQGQISSGTLYLLDRNNSCYALAHSISPYALFRVYKLEGELWKEQSLRDFVKL